MEWGGGGEGDGQTRHASIAHCTGKGVDGGGKGAEMVMASFSGTVYSEVGYRV
jgi:hypothetical protein